MFKTLFILILSSQALFDATLYKQALQLHDEGDPLLKENLGWAYFYENRYDEAITALDTAKTPQEHLIVGLCLKKIGDLRAAIEHFKQAKNPLELAIALKDNQNYEQAKAIFKTCDEKTANLWLARIALEENDLNLAESLIKKKTKEGKLLLGWLFFKKNDLDHAREMFCLYPQDAEFLYGLAMVEKRENPKEALKAFHRSFNLSPNPESLSQILELEGVKEINLLKKLPGCEVKIAQMVQGKHRKEILLALAKSSKGSVKEKILSDLVIEQTLSEIKDHLGSNNYEEAWQLLQKIPGNNELKNETLARLALINPRYKDQAIKHLSPYNQAILMLKLGDKEKALSIAKELDGDFAAYLSCLTKSMPFDTFTKTYPQSPFAAECDFRVYSWQQYLTLPQAKEALSKFPLKYPNSPYTIAAYYLLALGEKSPLVAIDHFKKARVLYLNLESPLDFQEIFHHASIQEVEMNLKIVANSQGVKKRVYLDEAQTILTPLLGHVEADYLDALITLQIPDPDLAREKFKKIIAQNSDGLFFAKSLYQLAFLEKENALNYLEKAIETGSCYLSDDERLSWCIEKAKLLISEQKFDLAMRTLSQAINDPCPSSVRIEAMLIRAEIYQAQGRDELAKKQLQAVANKGGNFAKIAKQKLDVIYGL